MILEGLVPKKGLEPPHPCEYMDLNHARLPIPPLRHNTRIGWFFPTGSIFESRKCRAECQIPWRASSGDGPWMVRRQLRIQLGGGAARAVSAHALTPRLSSARRAKLDELGVERDFRVVGDKLRNWATRLGVGRSFVESLL